MNSNKSEIYGLTRFQLHMHAVKFSRASSCICFPALIQESQQQIRES